MPALSSSATSSLYIGMMSGTSLDGVDAVLADFPPDYRHGPVSSLAAAHLPFPDTLRSELLALQAAGIDEIHQEALVANTLAALNAQCVANLLDQAGLAPRQINAIGVHGQTIRHRPELGYTRQINNAALLAELTGIDVIADFRSRDIAAGGQGAPLVPAFHQAVFTARDEVRVVANIGGISNISILPALEDGNERADQALIGFDTGPGNVLMDTWISLHQGQPYDRDGKWAAGGQLLPALLALLHTEAFLVLAPPKSTGRDLFHAGWLSAKLAAYGACAPQDIQATLAVFTATSLADAIACHARAAGALYVCGGGAFNTHLMQQLQQALRERGMPIPVASTDKLGVPPQHVEALAFAWLAQRFQTRQPGNLPSVTGAKGARILGALYPA